MNHIRESEFKDNPFEKKIQIQINNANGKFSEVKKQLEIWISESWKPITQKYKKEKTIISFFSVIFLASLFNLDTIMLIRLIWANRTISQIEEISAKAVTPDSLFFDSKCEIEKNRYWSHVESTSRQHQYRFFPLGWVCNDKTTCQFDNLRASPFRSFPIFVSKIFGLLFTALMVSLGADFWFKVLEKYIKVKV